MLTGRRRRSTPNPIPRWLAAALVSVVASACVPTARTAGPYRAKAVNTAEAVHSAVASDLLVIEAVRDEHTTAPYVSVATSQAEDDASSSASTFLSIQPPDDTSSDVRDELSDLLDEAQSALADARIAGRAGDKDALLESETKLHEVGDKLEAFQRDHQ